MPKGFTIIELTVVSAIIVLMTGLILPNWNVAKRQFALQRSVNKLAQDIRRAQEMALAAADFDGQIPYGYGVYFTMADPLHYIIFADLDDDGTLSWDGDAWDRVVETIDIETKVQLSQLSNSPLSVAFAPPMPTVVINPTPPAAIRLSVDGLNKSVCVNSLGLIEIADACAGNIPPVAVSCTVVDQPDGDGEVRAGENITFTLNGVATDADGSIVEWDWNWGDGSVTEASIVNPTNKTHTYYLPIGVPAADYTVKLEYAVDNDGAKSGSVDCPPPIHVIEPTAGNIKGYAWSEYAGWINFCPDEDGDGSPAAPVGSPDAACVRLDGNSLRGWAKVVNVDSWISFNCLSDPDGCSGVGGVDYGVSYDSITDEFSGYAWSEDYGWIKFNCNTSPDECISSIYKATFNPTVSNEFKGWVWSENIGWISLNCANIGEDPNACVASGYKVRFSP